MRPPCAQAAMRAAYPEVCTRLMVSLLLLHGRSALQTAW